MLQKNSLLQMQPGNTDLIPEQEIILWVIRVDREKDVQIKELLYKNLNWDMVIRLAIDHGLLPLLYQRLKQLDGGLIPPEKFQELKNLYLVNARRNLAISQRLLGIVDHLTVERIETVPIKGPSLAMQAYGDLSLRTFTDLDILIHKKDFARVYMVLKEQGFESLFPIENEIERRMCTNAKDFSFAHHNLTIEIHWNLFDALYAFPVNMWEIWEQTVSTPLEGREIRSLSPEDTLIFLAIHGMKHSWTELKWLADLSHFIARHPEIDWQLVEKRSRGMGARRIQIIGLILAQRYGGITYPEDLYTFLSSDETANRLAVKVGKNLFSSDKSFMSHEPVFFLKSRERMRDRIAFLVHSYFLLYIYPKYPDIKVVRLPEVLFPLYFFIRPFRLILNYGPATLRSIFKAFADYF